MQASEKLAKRERSLREAETVRRALRDSRRRTAPMIGVVCGMLMCSRPPTAHDAQRRLVVGGGA